MFRVLTIIVPTFNEETNLPVLLASIRRQSLQPDEIIVADARSTDRTRVIAAEFGARVVEGGLPGPGRNRGAEAARTDILLFLDADVELRDPHFLKNAINEFTHRALDVATCDLDPISARRMDHAMHAFYNRYTRALAPIFPHAAGVCIFSRKRVHDRINGFDESQTFCEDHDYVRRACRVGTFGILDSTRIPVSVRRLDRDGRLTIAVKFTLAELHLVLLGPIRHNGFRYTFGHKRKSRLPTA